MIQPEFRHSTPAIPEKKQVTIPGLKPGAEHITTGVSFEEAKELAHAASEYLGIPVNEKLQKENRPLVLGWIIQGSGSPAAKRSLFTTDEPVSKPAIFQDGRRICAQITVPGTYILQIPTSDSITPHSKITLLRIIRRVK